MFRIQLFFASNILFLLRIASEEDDVCSISELQQISDKYFCDSTLSNDLTHILENIKTENKYLTFHLENFGKDIKDYCPDFPNPMTDEVPACVDDTLPIHCQGADSGLYALKSLNPKEGNSLAYCLLDPDGGRPWLLIQRRDGNNEENELFNHTWENYVNGFGNLNNNFWFGLENIYMLTHSKSHELWIELRDFRNAFRHARYSQFAIGDSEDLYSLRVLGTFSGDAGDSLRIHEGLQFATPDKRGANRCAQNKQSGWWFEKCGDSNLNGIYYKKTHKVSEGMGVYWKSFKGNRYSYKYVHMAIRPTDIIF